MPPLRLPCVSWPRTPSTCSRTRDPLRFLFPTPTRRAFSTEKGADAEGAAPSSADRPPQTRRRTEIESTAPLEKRARDEGVAPGQKTLRFGSDRGSQQAAGRSTQAVASSNGSPLPFRIRKLGTGPASPQDGSVQQGKKPDTSRSVNKAKMGTSTRPSNSNAPSPGPNRKSLFAELFPEAVEQPASPPSAVRPKPTFNVSWVMGGSSPDAPKAVMAMRGLSPNLHLDDFQRCVPEGKHIPGWTSQGQFTRVIPERHPITTERTCNYYLLFPTDDDLRAYERRVTELHKLSVQHTPTSLLARLTPPPGYRVDDVDVHRLLQNFTLVPPTQRVHVRALHPDTLRPAQRFLARHGETHYLADVRRRKVPAVLFGVTEGRQPSAKTIRSAILADGERRGVRWELAEEGEPIQAVNVAKPTEWGRHQPGGPEASGEPAERERAEEGMEDEELAWEGRKIRSPLAVKWLIHFKTERDAVGFARRWNRRPFPWPERSGTYLEQRRMDDLLSQVTAEAIV